MTEIAPRANGRSRQDLVVDDLVKVYPGGVYAVNHVSLTIPAGQFVTLLGPSGCGKTTTLNCIAGLENPDAGRIIVGDLVLTDPARRIFLPPERRDLGMVFQSYALWPHMTVYDNLAFGLKLHRVPGGEIRKRIEEALALVNLTGMERRYPFQLSGGQQQRVALARAVVARPRVLLLDEPLSNLDAKVREQARFWLRDLQQRLGITTVYVTHDQAEGLAISDLVAVMSAGHLLQYAPPKEIYERPASRFVADFIGQTSFLPATVLETAPALRVRLNQSGAVLAAGSAGAGPGASAWRAGEPVLASIRSERITLLDADGDGAGANSAAPHPAENTVPATIASWVYVGSDYEYLLDTPDGQIRADSPYPVAGPAVRLRLPPESIVVLRDEPAPRPTTAKAASA